VLDSGKPVVKFSAMFRACRTHLAEAGETYAEHMRFALTVGALAIGAGLACVVHAFVPAVCPTTCSRTVVQLQRLFADRNRLAEVAEQSSGVTVFVGLVAISSTTALIAAVAGAGAPVTWLAALQSLAFPLLYVAQNPALDPV
jgi:hypothetical protein